MSKTADRNLEIVARQARAVDESWRVHLNIFIFARIMMAAIIQIGKIGD